MTRSFSRFKPHTLGLMISTALFSAAGTADEYALRAADDGLNVPNIITSAGASPVIDIVAPQGDVSHNRFQDFNVGAAGVIFNNSAVSGSAQIGSQSQAVAANPQLAQGTARVILNEVVGTHKSTIHGPQAIFGDAADYVLSNPNGIDINGSNMQLGSGKTATFIVGHRGDAQVAAGPGRLEVGERGLDVEGGIALIAPVLKVKGATTATANLAIRAGAYILDTASGRSLQRADSDAITGIDAQLLGAMRAHRIDIVSSGKGAGVNMEVTNIQADQGIDIAADGVLIATSVSTADGRRVAGTLNAGAGDLNLAAGDDMHLESLNLGGRNVVAQAQGKLTLDAQKNEVTRHTDPEAPQDEFVLGEGFANAAVSERELTHVKNIVAATGAITLKSGNDMLVAATDMTAHTIDLKSERRLDVIAKVDERDRNVRASDATGTLVSAAAIREQQASTTSLNAQSITLSGHPVTLQGVDVHGEQSIDIFGSRAVVKPQALVSTRLQGSEHGGVRLRDEPPEQTSTVTTVQRGTLLKTGLDRGRVSFGNREVDIMASTVETHGLDIRAMNGDVIVRGALQETRREHIQNDTDGESANPQDQAQVRYTPSQLSAATVSIRASDVGVNPFAKGDVILQGVAINAAERLDIDAAGQLSVSAGQQMGGGATTHVQSTLSSTGSIGLTSGSLLNIAGSTLSAKGAMKLVAPDIQLTASLDDRSPRLREIWLDDDYHPSFYSEREADGNHLTVHHGVTLESLNDVELVAQRLATHAAVITAAEKLTVSPTLYQFKDTPVVARDNVLATSASAVGDQEEMSADRPGFLALSQGRPKREAGQTDAEADQTFASQFVAGLVDPENAALMKRLGMPLTVLTR
ncbi:hemagglutinin repeat-containing protein [Pseudomonas sp. UBA4194]|uniref:two-partner secretion domain-containing protein n=1 Tax=Pseudomonas sp. UBA4194 TaxID=1947317 RepID=UPI0025FE5E20|nr:hemagglutinin repeat-containing protein [Pseudomonas sp. UBA4194]